MSIYQWNQLGINEVTNLYLYGQTIKPADLLSESLIRPSLENLKEGERSPYWVELDAVSFMATALTSVTSVGWVLNFGLDCVIKIP